MNKKRRNFIKKAYKTPVLIVLGGLIPNISKGDSSISGPPDWSGFNRR